MLLLQLALLLGTTAGCYRPASELLPAGAPIPSRVLSPTPHQKRLALGAHAPPLPDVLDWRNYNGTSFAGKVSNQLVPSPCGSCWAFASAGALADRVSIASGGLKFDISPQGLLDCAAPKAGSCNGGSHVLAYDFATEIGLTDSSCLPYRGMDHSNWGETDCKQRMCRNCDRFGTCSFVPYNETLAVRVVEHGTVRGVDAMKAEIAARGPIACSMYAHADAFEKYAGGVIGDTTRYTGTTHVVVVAGWGRTADGVPFWIVRNSFGTNWGELGWYRAELGKDIYNMEANDCSWAIPDPAFAPELRRRSGMA